MEQNLPESKSLRSFKILGPTPNFKFGPKACLLETISKENNIINLPYSSCQILRWDSPPRTILIIKKLGDTSINEAFFQMITWLIKEYDMNILVEKSVMEEELLKEKMAKADISSKISTYIKYHCNLNNKVDFIICLGGDGTLLYASSIFQESVPPIMAFHLGSLGFLAPFDFTDYKLMIKEVLQGNCQMILRSRLTCVLNNPDILKHEPSHSNVLNEIVIDRGLSPFLSAIELHMEDELITVVQGDGLIICTPTGSTAYACAAGSSMVNPGIPAIVITPICPHSLSFRPIVVPAGVEIKVTLSPISRSSAWVSFDGQNKQELKKDDSLIIKTSIYPVPSICFRNQIFDWFAALENSLHWNQRSQQKKLNQ